jgi:CIC family chloride channel protein
VLQSPRAATRRAYDWLRGSPGGLVALALVVGAGAGAGAVFFRYLIEGFTLLFTGHLDYTVLGHVPNPHLPSLGAWYVLFVPAIGALLFGPLIEKFARETRGHGVPEVMVAVALKGGRIRPRVAVIKSIASALDIGSGGSVGREGPIVQIGSALGSTLGQWLRLPDSRLRLLVACGAAGGISATFNAPLAGVFFALEIILINFRASSFAVVVLSSVTADVVGRAAFGAHPFLVLPPFQLVSFWEYFLYAALGVFAAVAGVGFIRVLYGLEDILDRVWRFPEWLRPFGGGVILGVVIFVLPEMYGVGYPVISRIIDGHYVTWFLLILLAGKILATSLTLSSGGSGGVFAPSLFMGAALGTAFGGAVHAALPSVTAAPGAYGLVGMAAVFGAAARAPITAVLIVFELTGDYRIILPLMFAVALSTTLSRRMSSDTIYTLKLRRRGIDVTAQEQTGLMELLRVSDAMRPIPELLRDDTPLDALPGRLEKAHANELPVADGEGAYRGVVTLADVQDALAKGPLDQVAGDLATQLPTVEASQTLGDALGVLMAQEEGESVPVVDAEDGSVVGWLGQRDVLLAYSKRLKQEAGEAAAAVAARPQPTPATEPGSADLDGAPGLESVREAGATTSGRTTHAPPQVEPDGAGAEEPAAPPARELADYTIVDVIVERGSPPVGRRLDELGLPESASVVAVRRAGTTSEPDESMVIAGGDILSVIVPRSGADTAIEALRTKRPRGDDGA